MFIHAHLQRGNRDFFFNDGIAFLFFFFFKSDHTQLNSIKNFFRIQMKFK